MNRGPGLLTKENLSCLRTPSKFTVGLPESHTHTARGSRSGTLLCLMLSRGRAVNCSHTVCHLVYAGPPGGQFCALSTATIPPPARDLAKMLTAFPLFIHLIA